MIALIGFLVTCVFITAMWGPKQTTADFGGLLGAYLIAFIGWALIGIGTYDADNEEYSREVFRQTITEIINN